MHLKDNLMDRVLNTVGWWRPIQAQFSGPFWPSRSFLFGGVKSAPLQTLPNNIYLNHKWSIYDKYCCENQRSVDMKCYNWTIGVIEMWWWCSMVMTSRKILATIVSLVIALARESLYKNECFLYLTLKQLLWEGRIFNEAIHWKNQRTLALPAQDKDYINILELFWNSTRITYYLFTRATKLWYLEGRRCRSWRSRRCPRHNLPINLCKSQT